MTTAHAARRRPEPPAARRRLRSPSASPTRRAGRSTCCSPTREAEHIPGCNMAVPTRRARARSAASTRSSASPATTSTSAGGCIEGGLDARLQPGGARLAPPPRLRVRGYLKQQRGYGRAEALLERKWPEQYNVERASRLGRHALRRRRAAARSDAGAGASTTGAGAAACSSGSTSRRRPSSDHCR